MTQEEIDLVFNIAYRIHSDTDFKNKSIDEVQSWVKRQLALIDIFTIPIGSSWGMKTSKNNYE